MEIRAKFFGEPEVYLDNKQVLTQNKKLLALFLFLLFHGHCSRDEIASKFWGGYSPDDSKRNLRNALYNLKSIVGPDVIVGSGKNHLFINPDIGVVKDTDIFITENNERRLLEMNDFAFMDKLSLPRCPEFEDWQAGIHRIYEKMLLERLENGLRQSEENANAQLTEKYADKLLRLNPYDEKAMESLLRLSLQKGLFNKAVMEYKVFAARLKKDLDVKPGEELQALYSKALGLDLEDPAKAPVSDDGGLLPESGALQEEYQRYLAAGEYRNCIVFGALGCGKARTIKHFLKGKRADQLLEIHIPGGAPAQPYHAIALMLATLIDHYQLPHLLTEKWDGPEPLRYIHLAKQLVSFFRNSNRKAVWVLWRLERMDVQSLHILLSTFFDREQTGVLAVGTYTLGFCDHRPLLSGLSGMERIRLLHVKPLSRRQTKEYLLGRMDQTVAADENLDRIYMYTRGNLLFLKDVIAHCGRGQAPVYKISEWSEHLLREAIASLSTRELSVMRCLCACEHGLSARHLSEVTGWNAEELAYVLEGLFVRDFVEESEYRHNLLVRIRWRQIRDILYVDLPQYQRMRFHRGIAKVYEREYARNQRDYFVLCELKDHYEQTDLAHEKLLYTFVELEHILNYTDDFFPTFRAREADQISFSVDRSVLYRRFGEYEERLRDLEDQIPYQQLGELHMRFNFMIGRTYNRDGKREKGITYIRELTQMAQSLGNSEYLIKGYLETVYYGVKRGDADLMAKYIAKVKAIPEAAQDEMIMGIVYRVEGLEYLWKQDFTLSEECLKKSISIFTGPRLRSQNVINAAAAYDYMGYLYRTKGDYTGAEFYIREAIALCEEKNIRKSLDLFYEDLGYTYFLQEEYEKAREALGTSLRIYDEMGTYWLRSVAESCMAMIELREGHPDKAVEHYRRAGIFSRKESARDEMVVLEMARSMMHRQKLL